MAASIGKVVSLERGTAAAGPVMTAIDATDGLYLPFSGACERALIILENSDAVNAADVTLAKGDAYAAAFDLEVSLAAGQTKYLVVESAKYLITAGANRGKLFFEDDAGDVKVGLINLP